MKQRKVVLDASAVVDLLIGGPAAPWLTGRLAGIEASAPGHMPAEVLSALGRRYRAGHSSAGQVTTALNDMRALSLSVHDVGALVPGAWARRDQIRLVDALYVELASQLDTMVITTDQRLARATPLAVAPPE